MSVITNINYNTVYTAQWVNLRKMQRPHSHVQVMPICSEGLGGGGEERDSKSMQRGHTKIQSCPQNIEATPLIVLCSTGKNGSDGTRA